MRPRKATVKMLLLVATVVLSVQFTWSQTVKVTPKPMDVTAGGSDFDLTVEINGVSNLQASHVEFTFDNTLLEYKGATRGSVMNGTDDIFKAAPTPGPSVNKVTVDQAVIGATPADGNGTLFTMSFTPLKGGSAPIDLTVTLRDPANNTITATVTDGLVNVTNPAPTLASILPTTKAVGDAQFTLTVNGTNFVNGASTVNLNGSARTTSFVNASQLTATIPAADLLTAGLKNITVVNAGPGGGTSLAQTLTVNKGSTNTTVSSSDSPSDSAASVTFTATVTPSAATGSVEFFDGAISLGTGTLSSGSATLAIATLAPGMHTIKAVYGGDANYLTSENTTSQQVDPVIKASAGPNGSISPSGQRVVSLGGSLNFNIIPDPHHHVADVLVDGVSVGAVTTYNFTGVTRNHTISATFAIDTYTLNITAVNGTVAKSPDKGVYDWGDVVQLTPTAASHYHFVNWSGDATGTTNPLTLVIDGNKSITANFAIDTYAITASAGSGGTVTPAGITNVNYGGSQLYAITPATGYHVVDVLVDLASQGAITSYNFPNVTAPHTISATFAINTYTLTVNTVGSGSVTKNPATGPYNHGSVVQLTATADPGYTFTGWSGDVISGTNPLDVTMDGNKTITATFSANAYTVTVSGTNGTVTKIPDKTNYAFGESVQLSATANTGYHFVDWSGDAAGTTNPVTITVDGNKSVTANFAVNTYSLTVNTVGSGTVGKNPDQPLYNHGTVVQLTATASPGYTFTGWSGGATGTTNPVNVTMDANKTITATFTAIQYTVSATGTNGSVTKNPDQATYLYNDQVQLTAVPSTGYNFTSWSGDASGSVNPLTITVNANKNITANFSLKSYTITVTAGLHGTITPAGPTTVAHGGNQHYDITPDLNYHVVDVKVDNVSQGAITSFDFTNVTSNRSIEATFAINTHTLTVNVTGNGSVAKNPPTGPYDHGTVVRLTPTADPGYTFAGWSGDATGSANPLDVTMDGNKTITATFTANAYSVTIVAVNGTVTKSPDKTTYGWGESVQLTATPGTGYSFGSWSGDATGTTNPVTITINGNKNVTANFTINNYSLTTTVIGSGTITRNPDQASYNYNTSVQLTATPTTGYDFTGWTGALTGTANPGTVLMTGPKSVTATFTIKTYTITVTAGAHGTITPAGPTTVNYNGSQHYAIAPDPGYHIIDVKVDNVSQGAITSYDFTNVTSNRSIEATFGINSYTITVSAGANGTVAPAGPGVSVNHGDSQLFTFNPTSGYHVATLTIDGVRINPQATYTFPGVTGNHSIGVTFAVDNYAITGPAEYNLDVDGNSVTDMKVNLTAKPAGDATISAIAYVTPPAGMPAMPPAGLPFYLVVNSTLPEHQFAATVRLDLNGLAGFGPASSLGYYSTVTSSWILVDGTYLASDPVFNGHPTFTFQTDHFTPFMFFEPELTPVHLYGSTSSAVAAGGAVYPNNEWRPVGPPYGASDDWSWSGSQAVNIYLVPEVGAHFGSADITLEWDATMMSLSGVNFGSAPNGMYGTGQAYSPSTTVTTPYGPDKVRIQCTRGDNGNFFTTSGQYIARVDFTLLKPGHSPVGIIGADFEILRGNQKPYLIPVQAEVKAYLADIAEPGNENSGDGKVDFEDLVEWSYSYWAGVPGYTGSATYKVKYDFGPTADNYIFSLPQIDGKIDFEDLLIFSIGYGQTAGHYLPKIAVPASPVEISLGAPIAKGDEVDIPVVLSGSVTDVRGLKLEFGGQFGAFLGAEKGELLKGYSSPVPLMSRTEGRSVYLDLAVMGLDANAIDRPGEVAMLRFAGTPRIQLNAFEGRGSRNTPLEMKKVRGAGETQPTEFALLQNYPNPFNPSTTIEYQLPAQAMTDIEIYNMLGERVATIVHEVQPAGFYTVKWNGTNDNGAKVATGVYLYRMRAGDFTLVKKMLLVK